MKSSDVNLTVIANFLGRFGPDALDRLTDYLNDASDTYEPYLHSKHLTHKQIAEIFGTDRANLTRLINSSFDVVYIPKRTVRDYLDGIEQLRRDRVERQRKTVARVFQLVPRTTKENQTPSSSSR